jgi:hypothetical protein
VDEARIRSNIPDSEKQIMVNALAYITTGNEIISRFP